jgi:hypothetical protein
LTPRELAIDRVYDLMIHELRRNDTDEAVWYESLLLQYQSMTDEEFAKRYSETEIGIY